MKNFAFLFFIYFFATDIAAQPIIQWQKSLGGASTESANSIQQTGDGGYVVTGSSGSNDGDVTGNHGNIDCWVVKLTDTGDIQWQKSLGGSGTDYATSIQQTGDGGYIVAGYSDSNDGDVSGNHGDNDFWVVKLTDAGGIQWQKSLGGIDDDEAYSIQQTGDGGYIVAGRSNSSGGDVSGNHGGTDFWVVKLTDTGDIQWQKSLGGGTHERANSIQQTGDGGYIVAGWSGSNNGDVTGNHGFNDCWVVKLSDTGDIQWQKSLGSSEVDIANSIQQTGDGGYIVAGWSGSNDGDVSGNHGLFDYWVVKLSDTGDIQWQKSLGGSGTDNAYSIQQTGDGGYVVAGYSKSNDGDVSGNHGNYDYWVVKLSDTGVIQWQNSLGGSGTDNAYSIQQTGDGGYVVAGQSNSNDGDVSGNHGSNDCWVVKLFFSNTALTGTVHHDPQADCLPDPTEPGLANWLVQAEGAQSFFTLTDSLGHYFLPVDTGSYALTITPTGPYWAACNSPVSVTAFYDTLAVDFPVQAAQDCPYLTVDISAPFLRRCFENNYYVHYCNDGTVTAEDASVEVTLDPYFTYISSSIPPASQNGNTLTFDIGDVAVNDCGSFYITAYLSCDSTVLGQTHCTSAHISPDSLCLPSDPLWDGSSIEVDVACNGDSVTFTITNVGLNDMPSPLSYIIIEDQIVLLTDEFQLENGQSTTVTVPANGSTLRLEAQQAAVHPSGFASTGATIEGCGGWMSIGLFTQWAFDDDPDPFTDVDCQTNVGSYDPNDKQGFPNGLGDEHLIEPGQDIEYLVRFQNTGTDTAFKVVVVDVLPPELDLATVQPGASSHPYTYGVTPEGWLTFTFENIMLPDSNVNEAASHGFVRFRVSQMPGLSHGDSIENTALIYFDFNEPVQTNTYRHRIGQLFLWTLVGTVQPVFRTKTNVKVVPNPLTHSALLQVEGIEPGPLRLVLTDVSGKILRQQTTQGTGFEFQRGELAPGVYFFQIERNGERVGSGKLMVR